MSIFRRARRAVPAFVAVLLLVAGSRSMEAQTPKALDADLRRMLGAVLTDSYDQFLANADPTFKSAMNKEIFEAARKNLEPRLKLGYDIVYLGHMKQQGFQFQMWKLVCKDNGDDYFVKMGTQQGKVVGFTVE